MVGRDLLRIPDGASQCGIGLGGYGLKAGKGGNDPGGVTELLFGQIAAVGTRIRRQLLFIERLRGIQNLLRGHAELGGRGLLKRGKAMGQGDWLFLLFACDGGDDAVFAAHGIHDALDGGPIDETAFTVQSGLGFRRLEEGREHPRIVLERCLKDEIINGGEGRDFPIPVDDKGKGGRLDAPHR